MIKKLTPGFRSYIWGGTRLKTEYGKDTDLDFLAESWEYQGGNVLIKLIDAREPLSVQVHPDDAYARVNEGGGKGKTELWVMLDAAIGADAWIALLDHRKFRLEIIGLFPGTGWIDEVRIAVSRIVPANLDFMLTIFTICWEQVRDGFESWGAVLASEKTWQELLEGALPGKET